MATFRAQGIILRKTDRGEADQLFSIYTDSRGKVSALGRGVRKIQSKLNGHLQPFTVSQLLIAPGRVYDHVAGAESEKVFWQIRSNVKKIVLANYALELVDAMTRVGQPDERIFELLVRYLTALDEHDFSARDWQAVRQAFVIKLMTLLGFEPPVDVTKSVSSLDKFLEQHLDQELQTAKFLVRLR